MFIVRISIFNLQYPILNTQFHDESIKVWEGSQNENIWIDFW
jgi:hypothetical protein